MAGVLVLVNVVYFYINYLYTGDYDGGDRIHPDRESFGLFLWLLFKGLFNEMLIIRNYYFYYQPEWLWWVTTAFQLGTVGIVIRKFKVHRARLSFPANDLLPQILFAVGFFYLLVLIVIRKFSPFDPFNYRLLSPFTLLVFLGIQLLIVHQYKIYLKVRPYIFILLIASLLLNLPKVFIVSKIRDILT